MISGTGSSERGIAIIVSALLQLDDQNIVLTALAPAARATPKSRDVFILE
jgi:hypothetical protein